MNKIDEILFKSEFSKEDIVLLLKSKEVDKNKLFSKVAQVKEPLVGKKVYFRGLAKHYTRAIPKPIPIV